MYVNFEKLRVRLNNRLLLKIVVDLFTNKFKLKFMEYYNMITIRIRHNKFD